MKTIDPLELGALLQADTPVDIIDVRPRDEFENMHIEGAHSLPADHISVERLLYLRQLLPTEPLYIVSENGALAELCARGLERQGVRSLLIVSGGMHAWQKNGLPVVREVSLWEMSSAA